MLFLQACGSSRKIKSCILVWLLFLELREEDSPDKANEYIEKCIGTSEPIVKVSKHRTRECVGSKAWRYLLAGLADLCCLPSATGVATDVHAECG